MQIPSHPFPQLVPARVAAALRRLEERIWFDPRPLSVEATAPTIEHRSLAEARSDRRVRVQRGDSWGRLFDQRWCRLELPALGASHYLHWADDGEATLWVGDMPHYGFDVAHRRAPLPAGPGGEVWVECYCCQSAFWHPEARGLSSHGSVFTGATLLRRDDEAWEAYHDLKCLYDLAQADRPETAKFTMLGFQPALWRAPVLLRRLLRALNDAVNALDVAGVAALRRSLAEAYAELRDNDPLLQATLTGHAHIDLVWLWPERIGEAKAVHTFATVNRLMERYPELRFAYSQPASYEAVSRRAPALAAAVGDRMRSGRWQATGALYVESDTLLPCGEALARSFILGQEAFMALRGETSRLAWLPDVFGYSACLPQIMKLAGVDYFFTTKLTWSAVNRFPYSSFIWRGVDGSEILTHVTQETGYNTSMQVDELRSAAEGHTQAAEHPEFLQPTGYGDGGGGPTDEMCERVRRFADVRGVPALRWDHPEAFFDRLATLRHRLPTYHGECYLEFHRGTYTTQADVKAAYRALERALQLSEAVSVATARMDLEDEQRAAWHRLIFAQFHDCLPGSSIPDVYAEILPELRRLAAEQATAASNLLHADGESAEDCLFNPLPVARTVCRDGVLLRLPPLAGVAVREAVVVNVPAIVVRELELTNGRVKAKLDANGHLAALSIDGRAVEFAGPAARLVTYADKPSAFDAWDIDRHTLALAAPVNTPVTLTSRADGIVASRAIGQSSMVEIRYWLNPGESVLRMTLRLDWQEPETLLKLHFPTAYQSEAVRCGSPFGSVLRSQVPGASHTEAMWEVPVSRHASVGDAGEREGLFVVTEAKYGLSCRSGDLALTLLRSPCLVGYEAHRPSYPAGLSRHVVDSNCSDLGEHVIELAIGRLGTDLPLSEQPAALADLLYTPPVAYRGQPIATCLQSVSSDSLWPCWVKPEEDGGWILRFHEVLGRRGVAQLTLAEGWTAVPVDLRGRPIGRPIEGGRVDYRPYQIVSLKLCRSGEGDAGGGTTPADHT